MNDFWRRSRPRSVATPPGPADFSLADGSAAAGRVGGGGGGCGGGGCRVGVVVVVGIVVVVVVLHHLVAVLFAQQIAADERVPVAGHQLSLAFGACKTLDVVDTAASAAAADASAAWLQVGSGAVASDAHHQFVGRDALAARRARSRTAE